ncbi:hypothetical protein [Effusibacillus pohliae]|nr:hypothetical protein [Effusibacillus pohliae]
MIFEPHSPGKVIVSEDLLLEWKEKAKKYEDLLQELREQEHPATKQGGEK